MEKVLHLTMKYYSVDRMNTIVKVADKWMELETPILSGITQENE